MKKNLILLIFCSVSVLYSTSKASFEPLMAPGFNQASFDSDMQRSRLESTWQFHIALGTGVLTTDRNSELSRFSNYSGFGLPLAISFAAYHPRSTPGQLHWGYALESVHYKKSKSAWIVDESYEYNQSILGGGLLYYFDESRQNFFRASLGLAGANFNKKSKLIFDDEQKKELASFTNGLGLSMEVGSTFQLEVYKNLFTYTANLSYVTAKNLRNQNNIGVYSLTAKVGVLW